MENANKTDVADGVNFKKLQHVSKLQVTFVFNKHLKNFQVSFLSIYGTFEMGSRFYTLRDVDLIKKIAIKDFDHFLDHRMLLSPDTDPLLTKSLFFITGQKWRDMRAALSPAFTGSKMRNMFSLVTDCTNESIVSIKSNLKGEDDMFEMKEFFSKFTVDAIATCAFGIKVNSFKNPENEFKKMTNAVIGTKGVVKLRLMGIFLLPKLMKLLNIGLLNKKVNKFFQNAVCETMAVRDKEGIVRPDMINLLMLAKKGKLDYQSDDKIFEGHSTAPIKMIRKWTDDELVAQCMSFVSFQFIGARKAHITIFRLVLCRF